MLGHTIFIFNIRRKGQSPKLYFMDAPGGRCAFFTAHRDLYRSVLVHFRDDGNLITVGGQNLAPLEAIYLQKRGGNPTISLATPCLNIDSSVGSCNAQKKTGSVQP